MVASTLTFALAALLFLQAHALEYEMHNLTYCPEIPDERAYLSEVHTRIQDDQQQYIGNVTMFKDFGNDNNFVIEAYRIIDDKEVHLLTYKGEHACSMLVVYGADVYLRLAGMANVENPTNCPIAKKDYFLADYFGVRLDELVIPVAQLAPKGKFRVKITLTDPPTGNVDFCCQFYGELF